MVKSIDRRNFIASAATATAAGVLFPQAARGAKIKRATIHVVHGADIPVMLAAGLRALGGLETLVKKGGKVTVKPNAAWASRPDQAGNTHPELVEAFVASCRKAGAAQVVLPEHTCSPASRAFSQSGIQAACERAGGTLIEVVDEAQFKTVAIPKGKSLKSAQVATDVLETDLLVNMPVAKSHGSAVLTLSMKNWMGSVFDRRFWHANDLSQCIADMSTLIRPKLIIIDATRIMTTGGPRGPGKVEKPGQLIFGTDPVATDAYATTLFKLKPFDVPHIRIAHEMGIGCGELDAIEVRHINT